MRVQSYDVSPDSDVTVADTNDPEIPISPDNGVSVAHWAMSVAVVASLP